jgi:glycine cleavage system transcriptional repressor
MARRYIISLTGSNRVGILAAVTTALDELRGNLQEASISVMPPFCSILLTADFPDDRTNEVVSGHIRDLCRPFKVEVRLSEQTSESGIGLGTPATEHVLTVWGPDKPGVLRLLATKMSELGVDIRNLYAERKAAEQSFLMELELAIPLSLDLDDIRHQIGLRCEELGLRSRMESYTDFVERCGGNLRDAVRVSKPQ